MGKASEPSDSRRTLRLEASQGWVSVMLSLAAAFLLVIIFLLMIRWIWPFTESPRLWGLDPGEAASIAGSQLQARAIVVQILGGLFLALTFITTLRNLWLTQEQLKLGREERLQAQAEFQASQTQQDSELRISREGQITERFTRATDQLGSDSLMTRLGGIYALERIARDSEDDHWPVMEVLTAYVRENARLSDPPPTRFERNFRAPTDIQAVITVIARRDPERKKKGLEPWGLDLSGTDLRDIEMEAGFFEGANFYQADLKHANLRKANLQGARFMFAQLQQARCSDANFQRAYLGYAELSEASLYKSQFDGATLDWTRLEGVDLTFARGLTQAQIDMASMDELTRLPHGSGPDGQPYRRSPRNWKKDHQTQPIEPPAEDAEKREVR
jgi:hypothetical protein